MSNYEKLRRAREGLVTGLGRYFVGPLSEDEEIRENPWDRYHTGFLTPPEIDVDAEEDDQDDTQDVGEGGGGESILALANVSQQSAMGMTFHVLPKDIQLTLKVRWATYERRGGEGHEESWSRKPFSCSIPFTATPAAQSGSEPLKEVDGINIYATVRAALESRTITVSVVNRKAATKDRTIDNRIYQVELSVEAVDGAAVFVARPPSTWVVDEELWNFELLYRNARQFAVGHGCSVGWDPLDKALASKVFTAWLPVAEVFKASTDILGDDPILRLDALSKAADRPAICEALGRLPKAYSQWIKSRQDELARIVDDFPAARRREIREAGEANILRCKEALIRMEEGIALLLKDQKVWDSFCLTNRALAMSMRQARSAQEPSWRAFQLAFILLALPSTALRDHKDRSLLDLIWFPTGGGKTEAYLGLAAFCMIHRRLSAEQPDSGAGTSVLTRYTLRLLTIQQFDRAARVICACELVRRDESVRLGKTEFSIGLFVGSGATPNSIAQAAGILDGSDQGDGNVTTLPLLTCPWCKTELSKRNQKVDRGRLVTACPGKGCPFSVGIPIVVVDEELYNYPPSMVIGTVDKFARMPWVPEMRAIFGKGPKPLPPPDMIIQDELHLIGDALGTVAALYEVAIDYLCWQEGTRPKIIGSTATIRRAWEHCAHLFERKACQFPPSGTDAADSFFYTEDRTNPGRLYVGLHAQGRSPKHTLARLVGTLAQGAKRIVDASARDAYYTNVLYFNSLRELGGALVLAEDDVPRYMEVMPREDEEEELRTFSQVKELTSNLPSSEIPEILKQLETPINELKGAGDLDREVIDLLLATNMISVGVDVDRLGLMVVNGQPKTTAEYIQATSRVGRPRASAGLVVTLYNWMRSRDRSHYERFVAYHQAFYRFVESTSVTPFSARARDRALHAVLVSLARVLIDDFSSNDSAGVISTSRKVLERVRELSNVIIRRAGEVDAEEKNDTADQLAELIEEWRKEAKDRNRLHWNLRRNKKDKEGLLRSAERDSLTFGLWPTPQSMRDVEPASPVRLLRRRQEEVDGEGS